MSAEQAPAESQRPTRYGDLDDDDVSRLVNLGSFSKAFGFYARADLVLA